MTASKAELRAALEAQAKTQIEAALAKSEGMKSITAIEELAYETGRRLGQAIEAELLTEREQVSGPGPACAECGQEMRYKGTKQRYVVTRNGEQQLERGYYYCPDCKRGLFPPG